VLGAVLDTKYALEHNDEGYQLPMPMCVNGRAPVALLLRRRE